jgi:hypothetical protein
MEVFLSSLDVCLAVYFEPGVGPFAFGYGTWKRISPLLSPPMVSSDIDAIWKIIEYFLGTQPKCRVAAVRIFLNILGY